MNSLFDKLPIELLDEVLCHITVLSRRSLSRFSRTCWLYYSWGTPLLYANVILQTYLGLRTLLSALKHHKPKRLLLPIRMSQKLSFLRAALRRGRHSPTRPSPLLYTRHIYVVSNRWNDPLTDEKPLLRAVNTLRHAYPNVQTLCLGSTVNQKLTVMLCKGWPASRLMLATEFHHHEQFFPSRVHESRDSLPNITHLFVPNITGSTEFLPGGAAKRFPNLTHLAFSCKPCGPVEARQIVETVMALLAMPWHLSRLVLLMLHLRDENPRETPLWRELVGRGRDIDPRLVAVGIVATQVEDVVGLHDCAIPLVDQWAMLVREGDVFWETGQQVFQGSART